MNKRMRTLWPVILFGILAAVPLSYSQAPPQGKDNEARVLVMSAIPDQDPETLKQIYGRLADHLTKELGVLVKYRHLQDYPAVVNGFKAGELHLVWFGGLTGVQARQQVPQAHYIAQRDIDEKFRSVFIANQKSAINTLEDLKGKSFTFGSEWSTSGRLMPQHFLKEKGVKLEDFKGKPGFSGSHDKTISLVADGTYDAGVMNEQVWKRHERSSTDAVKRVRAIHTSEPYHDYHWLLHSEAAQRLGGADFVKKVQAAFLKLDQSPPQTEILELFGAKKFIPTRAENYQDIERIARESGLLGR